MNILIPMAGRGLRVQSLSDMPKPLIRINNVPMLKLAVQSLQLEGNYIFIKRIYKDDKINKMIDDLIRSLNLKNYTVININKFTKGAAETCLYAADHINNNDNSLIIANCDQIMKWDSKDFIRFVATSISDVVLVTVKSNLSQHSYVRLGDNGLALEVREKEVISDNALTGISYWEKGKDFVSSAKELINENDPSLNEFHISMTYKHLINKDKKIATYCIGDNEFCPVGTPKDIQKYLAGEKK